MTKHPAEDFPHITMLSGVNIGAPENFRTEHFRMGDMIRGLAMQCRYRGQINRFYSIAEHSILVSRFVEIEGDHDAVIPALFHDAHEYITGDMASPQKDMIEGWRDFEDSIEATVREALGLPDQADEVWKRVSHYDTLVLYREIQSLKEAPYPDWFDHRMDRQVPEALQVVGHEWREAETLFRKRCHDLGLGLGGTI